MLPVPASSGMKLKKLDPESNHAEVDVFLSEPHLCYFSPFIFTVIYEE